MVKKIKKKTTTKENSPSLLYTSKTISLSLLSHGNFLSLAFLSKKTSC